MDDVAGNIPDRWMRDEKLVAPKKKKEKINSLMVGITSGWADNGREREKRKQ